MATDRKPKRHHATWEHEASRLKARQTQALENLEKRLGLPEEELLKTAKRFKRQKEVNPKAIESYRKYIKEQIKILKEKS